MKSLLRIVFVILLLFSQTLLFAEHDFHVSSSVNWYTGTLELHISQSTRLIGQNPASAATTATRAIHNAMPVFMLNALLELRVDSHRFVRDIARNDPGILRKIERLAETAEAKPARISSTLDIVTVPYSLQLFPGLTELLIRHHHPSPLEQFFQWQGIGEFTGLVIYAADPLPVRGESDRGRQTFALLQPSLLLRIFDSNLTVVVEPNRMNPDRLIHWGGAAYTTSFDETPYIHRIGTNPLRVSAQEIFGIHYTDLVLNDQARNILLYSEQNRRILQEGRILIILSDQTIVETLHDSGQTHMAR